MRIDAAANFSSLSIDAGGPGSGRHPGVHQALTDFGYQHVRTTKPFSSQPSVALYRHPDKDDNGNHRIVKVGQGPDQRWQATKYSPFSTGSEEKRGAGEAALRSHLQTLHGGV